VPIESSGDEFVAFDRSLNVPAVEESTGIPARCDLPIALPL
jgi:hypothetical protein